MQDPVESDAYFGASEMGSGGDSSDPSHGGSTMRFLGIAFVILILLLAIAGFIARSMNS
jgi:hypothetical protein